MNQFKPAPNQPVVGLIPALLCILLGFSSLCLTATEPDFEVLRERAATGDVDAQFELGRRLRRGDGVERDPTEAYRLTRLAAEQGHPAATAGLGVFYARGEGVERDDAQAFAWFQRGAELEIPTAMLNFGQVIRHGQGTEKNVEAGIAWIRKAADAGLPDAWFALGQIYFFGDDFGAPDYSQAVPHLEAAAQAGHAEAANMLGVCLRDGLGTERDPERAKQLFREAAGQNVLKAQANLAHAIGVETQDPEQQIEMLMWLMVAGDQGEITASRRLLEIRDHVPMSAMAPARAKAEQKKRQLLGRGD